MPDGERSLALFIDFENLALGFQGRRDRFDMQRVLRRMVEKGKIVAKKAYADWGRYSSYTETLHEAAIELIEIPRRAYTGKNSADIRLCVDAMDLAYSKEHIDTFIVVSGDSDFSPLVSKLKELGKHVIGLGMQESTSELLRDNCDEFIYYEDLETDAADVPGLDPRLPETKRKAFALLLDSLLALRRENKEVLWSSMVKDTIKRKKPSFNESYHGYNTFSALLEDAQKQGLIDLETDKRSGTYVVTRFGEEMRTAPPPPTEARREPRRSRPETRGRRDGPERTRPRGRMRIDNVEPKMPEIAPAAEREEPAVVEERPPQRRRMLIERTTPRAAPVELPVAPGIEESPPPMPPEEPTVAPPPPRDEREDRSFGFGFGIMDR